MSIQQPVRVKVLLDVHHYLPSSVMKTKGHFRVFNLLKGDDGATQFLRFASHNRKNQPFQLVWTAHHEFCVRNILAENDWSAIQIDNYVKACRALALATGGTLETIDYVKQSRTDSALKRELQSMGGTHRTPDLEDAAIVKMATDLRCDLIVTNDAGIRAAHVKTLVWPMETFINALSAVKRVAVAA